MGKCMLSRPIGLHDLVSVRKVTRVMASIVGIPLRHIEQSVGARARARRACLWEGSCGQVVFGAWSVPTVLFYCTELRRTFHLRSLALYHSMLAAARRSLIGKTPRKMNANQTRASSGSSADHVATQPFVKLNTGAMMPQLGLGYVLNTLKQEKSEKLLRASLALPIALRSSKLAYRRRRN